MEDRIKKKLHTALKLSGFIIRREFCSLIIEKCKEVKIDLNNNNVFDENVKAIALSLENQALINQSIEKEHINRALEVCLHSGYDQNETVFSVIEAFNFPKLVYNTDRKKHFMQMKKPTLLSDADSKAELFLERYTTILHRTKRNFLVNQNTAKLELQTIDYLLTLSHISLDKILILGSLLQVSEGKYYLEDPTGMVRLNLTHAQYYGGFFVENSFVLVNGHYEDQVLKVATIILPPGEESINSRPLFQNLNYFGGDSLVPLKDSIKLKEHLASSPDESIMFFANVWLDHAEIFDRLDTLFDGLDPNPPVAFVFMGNFLAGSHGSQQGEVLRGLMKQLGELICRFHNLAAMSHFVFVPGPQDPCTARCVPRFALPMHLTQEVRRVLPKAIFTTNPCRIQYCDKEIAVFRGDILPKLLQGSLYKPPKEDIAKNLTRTVISQGHLSPLPLNALPVHWDYDYALRLYPLPDLIVIGDKAETYQGEYKDCQLFNPGSFCENGFQFKAYIPGIKDKENNIQDCAL